MKKVIEDHFKGSYRIFYEKYLPKVKPAGGDEFKSVCPFHDDTDPSFNFNNQKGTYYCQGCDRKGHIVHFYAKLHGLDTRRDFPKILKGIASDFAIPCEGRKSKVVKTYDYLDSLESLLFQVCRMEPKDFRQRRPDGNGEWKWNLKGVTPILYRLPEVLTAHEVVIVEGEKDADAVASLGFCGTTCPMGAKKWKDHYSQTLKGKHVVLIPDNDQEGREHMAQVGASLNGVAASLKLIELPDLPSKGDLTDWVAKMGDRETAAERLAVLIENTDEYTPPQKATMEDAVLEAVSFTRLELPPKRIFLEPWLTEQSITLISGWRGMGKTWLALSMLDAISRGEPFGPWKMVESVPCLYLDGEMPVQDVQERLSMLGTPAKRKNQLYIYSDAYANSLGLARVNLLSESFRSKMQAILLARGVKLWAVDNLASLTKGIDENSKKDWDPINSWLLDLRFLGIATVLLHHTNKSGGQRGTSAREDNIDCSIMLKQSYDYTPEDGARFITSFQKARVRTQDLRAIADTQFQLTEDQAGRLVWSYGDVRKEAKLEILRLLDEGHSQSEVKEILGIDKGYISRIRKQAIKDGYMTTKNKLSQAGYKLVHEEITD